MTLAVLDVEVVEADWRDAFPKGEKPLPAVVTTVFIPSSIEDMRSRVNDLTALLTASEWELAAIIWACTTDELRGRPPKGVNTDTFPMPLKVFAAERFKGLHSVNTLKKYRAAWKLAIEHGIAEDIRLGDSVVLPTADWQTYFNPQVEDDTEDTSSDDSKGEFHEDEGEYWYCEGCGNDIHDSVPGQQVGSRWCCPSQYSQSDYALAGGS